MFLVVVATMSVLAGSDTLPLRVAIREAVAYALEQSPAGRDADTVILDLDSFRTGTSSYRGVSDRLDLADVSRDSRAIIGLARDVWGCDPGRSRVGCEPPPPGQVLVRLTGSEQSQDSLRLRFDIEWRMPRNSRRGANSEVHSFVARIVRSGEGWRLADVKRGPPAAIKVDRLPPGAPRPGSG